MVWLWLCFNLFVWVLLGRLIGLHAQAGRLPRPWLLNPGVSLVSGAAVWVMWWTVLVPLLGGGTLVAIAGFVFLTLGMAGAMYRTWHRQNGDNAAAQLVFSLLLALPLLAVVTQLWPSGPAWTFHQLVAQLTHIGGWPTPVQMAGHAYAPRATGPGWLALNLANVHTGVVPWQATAGLTLAAILALASTLRGVLEVPLRWSNLLLVTTGTLGITLMAYPVPLLSALSSAAPLAWTILAMVAAATPLLSNLPLPVGLSMVPPALAMALLVMLHPAGLPVVITLVILWLLRQGGERQSHRNQPTPALLSGWSLLLTLPVIAGALTVLFSHAAGQPWPFTKPLAVWPHWLQLFTNLPSTPTATLAWQLAQLAMAALVVIWSLLNMFATRKTHGIMPIFTTHAWLTVPGILLIVLGSIGLASHNLPMLLPLMLPWAALPLWRQAILIYRSTPLQSWAFRAPWRIGALLAAGLWVWLQSLPQPVVPTMAPSLLAAALESTTGELVSGQPVAVMAPTNTHPWIAYALANNAPIMPVAENWPSLAELHRSLRQAGAASLLVALPTPGQQQALQLEPHVLMATFHTTPNGLSLTGVKLNPLYDAEAVSTTAPLAIGAQAR